MKEHFYAKKYQIDQKEHCKHSQPNWESLFSYATKFPPTTNPVLISIERFKLYNNIILSLW